MAVLGAAMAGGSVLAQAQRSALAVLAIRIAGAGLAYATQVLLARTMGAAEYGIYAVVWVWIAILGHGSLWGLAQSVCRFVPEHRARGELDLVRGFLRSGALFTVLSAGATAVLAGALLALAWGRLGEGYGPPLIAALLVLPLFALQDYVEGVARSFHWATLAIAPPYILRQGLIGAALVLAVLAGAPAQAGVAILCTLLATALSLAVQSLLLLRAIRKVLPPGPRAQARGLWARASLPIAFVDLTQLGLSFVDVLLLGLFLPPEEVAIYFAATRILQFVVFVQYAASAATAPRFAEANSHGDRSGLRALARRTARLTALASALTGLCVLAAAPLLLALFGEGFSESLPALAVLVAGIATASLFGPAEDLLTMLGHERACALASLAALGLAIALNLALIPVYGVMGAAVATAIAATARGLALALLARRRLGFAVHVLARAQP